MSEDLAAQVHFGGPDLPPRALRDLLRRRIVAVPPGGEIAWATYYFRDRDLASALIAASDRGVRVTVQIEGEPRRRQANREVLAMLAAHGLNGGLVVHRPFPAFLHPHLHTKIYWFSHPVPSALVGSFNPSGDEPEDAEVVAEIGDQDRGHNLLVDLRDPALVCALHSHVRGMHRPLARLRNLWPATGKDTRAWFYPRLSGTMAEQALGRASQVRGCISHLKQGALTRALQAVAGRGAQVSLVVHDTQRRVPGKVVQALRQSGVEVRRYAHPDGLPMHAKFLLMDGEAWFGSYNFNPRSRWLNREILLSTRDPAILAPLHTRFEEISAAALALESRSGS